LAARSSLLLGCHIVHLVDRDFLAECVLRDPGDGQVHVIPLGPVPN